MGSKTSILTYSQRPSGIAFKSKEFLMVFNNNSRGGRGSSFSRGRGGGRGGRGEGPGDRKKFKGLSIEKFAARNSTERRSEISKELKRSQHIGVLRRKQGYERVLKQEAAKQNQDSAKEKSFYDKFFAGEVSDDDDPLSLGQPESDSEDEERGVGVGKRVGKASIVRMPGVHVRDDEDEDVSGLEEASEEDASSEEESDLNEKRGRHDKRKSQDQDKKQNRNVKAKPNPFAKTKADFEKKKREKEEQKKQWEDEVKNRKKQQYKQKKERNNRTFNLTKRTSRGQPVMRHQIDYLLDKIKKG